jgi:23S rRNA (guanosine2251-2'-O)-methyltransferase
MKPEVLYGLHPVMEALRARRRSIHSLCLGQELSGNRKEPLTALARSRGIPVEIHPMDRIQAISRTQHHQGVCARVGALPLTQVEAIVQAPATEKAPPFFLVIDSVLDPHNLGALIRSALAVGIHGVIIPKDRSAPPTPAVSKASAGALEHVRLARVTNLSRTLDIFKKSGIWIFGLDAGAGQSLYGMDLRGPAALVVGGEEKGIRPLVKQHCDMLVAIPQQGPLDSLNASVAGAVAMYEIMRQRTTYP